MKLLRSSTIKNDLGIALAIVGVPLGMYFNFLFPIVKWSPVFMAMSIFCIISFKNLINGKIPLANKYFVLIIYFQVFMLFYGLFSKNMTSQYFTFHLYLIILPFVLSTNSPRESYHSTIITIFILSGLASILGAYFLSKGFVSGNLAWQLRQENENYALEAFTVSNGAIVNFTSCIILMKKKSWLRIIFVTFIFLNIYIILFSGKRTPLFTIVLISVIYLFNNLRANRKLLLQYVKYLPLILFSLIACYVLIEPVRLEVEKFWNNFYFGIQVIMGRTDISDSSGSAIARVTSRQWTYDYIKANFNLINVLFGAGYMTRWIDNPLLQSYLDMGIIGIVLYFYLIIVFPIKTFFMSAINKEWILFAALLTVYNIVSVIHSGNPYLYSKYIPIIFLAYFVHNSYLNKKMC